MLRTVPLLALLTACSGKDDAETLDTADPTDTSDSQDSGNDTARDSGNDTGAADLRRYDFPSRGGSSSSVRYDGQVLRHLLLVDLKTYLQGLTARLDGGWDPEAGDVTADLDFYYRFDSATSGTVPHAWTSTPAPLQTIYDEVSTNKNLAGKIAGNDAVGQHRDWATDFSGWEAEGVTTPESLVRSWFGQLDAAAVAWSNGSRPLGPDGRPVPAVYLTAEGLDLRQLLQTFLTGAIAFSQGADDYLDDDVDGNGLLSSHAALEEGKPYTTLEHAWDEGFGYFGAARDYGTWADATIASPGYADTWTPDGAIDLLSEVSWGHAVNAAKRDAGAHANAPTDLTAEAWEGFLRGRALLARTTGPLTPEEFAELQGWRDQAVGAWEAAIAASVVHDLNEVLAITVATDDSGYDFAEHAAAWSEMKGLALSLQFHPRSPLPDAQFSELHALLGQAPVLPNAGAEARAAYAEALREARGLLGAAYGFDAANLGDDDGAGGW